MAIDTIQKWSSELIVIGGGLVMWVSRTNKSRSKTEKNRYRDSNRRSKHLFLPRQDTGVTQESKIQNVFTEV